VCKIFLLFSPHVRTLGWKFVPNQREAISNIYNLPFRWSKTGLWYFIGKIKKTSCNVFLSWIKQFLSEIFLPFLIFLKFLESYSPNPLRGSDFCFSFDKMKNDSSWNCFLECKLLWIRWSQLCTLTLKDVCLSYLTFLSLFFSLFPEKFFLQKLIHRRGLGNFNSCIVAIVDPFAHGVSLSFLGRLVMENRIPLNAFF
jgi:hypothetical protein